VQQRLGQIGVKVELNVTDWPTAVKVGWSPQGWNLFTHGFGIEPFEGPATVMSAWVNGSSQQKDDPEIDRINTALGAEMNADKRKTLFAEFQQHMVDNAVALKVGNYGLFQMGTVKLLDRCKFLICALYRHCVFSIGSPNQGGKLLQINSRRLKFFSF